MASVKIICGAKSRELPTQQGEYSRGEEGHLDQVPKGQEEPGK